MGVPRGTILGLRLLTEEGTEKAHEILREFVPFLARKGIYPYPEQLGYDEEYGCLRYDSNMIRGGFPPGRWVTMFPAEKIVVDIYNDDHTLLVGRSLDTYILDSKGKGINVKAMRNDRANEDYFKGCEDCHTELGKLTSQIRHARAYFSDPGIITHSHFYINGWAFPHPHHYESMHFSDLENMRGVYDEETDKWTGGMHDQVADEIARSRNNPLVTNWGEDKHHLAKIFFVTMVRQNKQSLMEVYERRRPADCSVANTG